MTSYEYVGISALLLMITIGFAFISIHYRKRYEELKIIIESE